MFENVKKNVKFNVYYDCEPIQKHFIFYFSLLVKIIFWYGYTKIKYFWYLALTDYCSISEEYYDSNLILYFPFYTLFSKHYV